MPSPRKTSVKILSSAAGRGNSNLKAEEPRSPERLRMRSRQRQGHSDPTAEERLKMIAEAAYYRAEHRNFEPGLEELDWFEAEREIESMLGNR